MGKIDVYGFKNIDPLELKINLEYSKHLTRSVSTTVKTNKLNYINNNYRSLLHEGKVYL